MIDCGLEELAVSKEMYEDRAESNASFIALPSDQLFDEIQTSAVSQKKRKRTASQSLDNDGKCYYGHHRHITWILLGGNVDQFLKDVPEIANDFTVISKIGTGNVVMMMSLPIVTSHVIRYV